MNAVKFLLTAVCSVTVCGSVFAAPPHHRHGSDGVILASQIVGLVQSVVAPPPIVIQQPVQIYSAPVYAVPPAPVYVCPPVYGPRFRPGPPPPPRHHPRGRW